MSASTTTCSRRSLLDYRYRRTFPRDLAKSSALAPRAKTSGLQVRQSNEGLECDASQNRGTLGFSMHSESNVRQDPLNGTV